MARLGHWEGPPEPCGRGLPPCSSVQCLSQDLGQVLLVRGKTEFGQKSKEEGTGSLRVGSWDSPSSFKKAEKFCFWSGRQERARPRTTVGCLYWTDEETGTFEGVNLLLLLYLAKRSI